MLNQSFHYKRKSYFVKSIFLFICHYIQLDNTKFVGNLLKNFVSVVCSFLIAMFFLDVVLI